MQKRTLGRSGLDVSALGATAVELTSEDVRVITGAASQIEIQGARYPEHLERRTGL
jgi:aryl-alcohol dehydrogenase-like predicted oxidoreductase